MYSVPEAAKLLGVHPKTLKVWLADGGIKGFRMGPTSNYRWWIPRAEIERLSGREV